MEKVPNTFLRATAFAHVCLVCNSFLMKLTMVMPIALSVSIR